MGSPSYSQPAFLWPALAAASACEMAAAIAGELANLAAGPSPEKPAEPDWTRPNTGGARVAVGASARLLAGSRPNADARLRPVSAARRDDRRLCRGTQPGRVAQKCRLRTPPGDRLALGNRRHAVSVDRQLLGR